MLFKSVRILMLTVACTALVSGCSYGETDEQYIESRGSFLTKISRALQAQITFEKVDKSLDGKALLESVVQHDPGLLDMFERETFQTRFGGQGAVVLVCTEGGQEALLEDVSCTAQLDKKYTGDFAGMPCLLTLDPEKICN